MTIDLSKIIQKNYNQLRRFSISLAGVELGEDNLQFAIEKSIKYNNFVDEKHFIKWMFRVIRNDWINFKQKEKRYVELDLEKGNLFESAIIAEDKREIFKMMINCMENLKSIHKEILLLISVEGLSYKEASYVQDVPVGTIMSRVFEARKGLMNCMQTSKGFFHE